MNVNHHLKGKRQMSNRKFRYRCCLSTSYGCENRFAYALAKVGIENITAVKGYSINHAAYVMLVTPKGTARFKAGLNWGYHGNGPSALRKLLQMLNVNKLGLDIVCHQTPMESSWELTKNVNDGSWNYQGKWEYTFPNTNDEVSKMIEDATGGNPYLERR